MSFAKVASSGKSMGGRTQSQADLSVQNRFPWDVISPIIFLSFIRRTMGIEGGLRCLSCAQAIVRSLDRDEQIPMFWCLSLLSISSACFFWFAERIRILSLQMPFVFFRVLIILLLSLQCTNSGLMMRIFWKQRVSIAASGDVSKCKLLDNREQDLQEKIMRPVVVFLNAAPVRVSKQGYRGQDMDGGRFM